MNCLTIARDGAEDDLRTGLSAPAANRAQPLYVSEALPQTRRLMVKDEDVCLHCGLCADRCPTSAWEMREFELLVPCAGRPTIPADAATSSRRTSRGCRPGARSG